MDETKGIFGPLKERTSDAVAKLEEQIALSESNSGIPPEELVKAREVLQLGQKAVEQKAAE
jgi:tubulin-specific chaperone A